MSKPKGTVIVLCISATAESRFGNSFGSTHGRFLISFGRQLARKGIVEIGRYHGGSTLVFALANPDVPIHSIDIAPKDDERLRLLLVDHEVGGNVHLLVGDSQRGEFTEIERGSYDLLLIDGDHSYDGCLADLTNWWPGLATGGSVLLHDCYHGCEVQEAVEAFFAQHAARFIRGTNIPAAHWLTGEGSIAHAVKT